MDLGTGEYQYPLAKQSIGATQSHIGVELLLGALFCHKFFFSFAPLFLDSVIIMVFLRNGARRTLSNSKGQQGVPFWASPISMLMIGLLTGGFLTYLLLLPLQSTVVVQRTASPALRSTTTKKESEGWHPIHVFYGKKEGLKLDPTKEWFAQVHQDEIVVDLLGENGYFVDLAANDAKELSNTVALEKHGWDGTLV